MAYVPPDEPESIEELRKRDALAFAELLYDIYQEKKAKESAPDEPESVTE
jgi:hypothetical protein